MRHSEFTYIISDEEKMIVERVMIVQKDIINKQVNSPPSSYVLHRKTSTNALMALLTR